MPVDQSLNRLLTALDVEPHVFSICRIQSGWRMTFPVFNVSTVHFVLQGRGALAVGGAAPLPFAPSSVLVVPALQPHWVGDDTPETNVAQAAEQCEVIGDGLVEFTAGDGVADTLLLCAAVSSPHDAALGLFSFLRDPVVDDPATSGIPMGLFAAMRDELANAGLGTQAMCQAYMKQALVALLRMVMRLSSQLAAARAYVASRKLAGVIGAAAAPQTDRLLRSLKATTIA